MTVVEQGIALLEGGRFHEAFQQFGIALRQQPLAAEPRIGLSQACQGMGDGWAAAAWLSDACRVAPERAELWTDLVKLLTLQQREGELQALLRTALAVHPDHVPLLGTQAELYLRSQRYAQALPAYARLRSSPPGAASSALSPGRRSSTER